MRRLALQHLANQVIANRTDTSRELCDESLWIWMFNQRDCSKAKARRPAVRS